jgi:predicted NBD/HSP70 family sugar kinase
VVAQLRAEGLVREVGEVAADKRGRRELLLDLAADRELAVGVKLGASTTRVLLTDLVGDPRDAHAEPTPIDLAADELGMWAARATVRVVGDNAGNVRRAVLVIPGAVSGLEQTISNSPNLPQVEDGRFLEAFRAHIPWPVVLENDANAALVGERRFGAAQGSSTAALVSLGTGLGAAIAIEGRLLRGRHGVVGEFGQLPVGPLGTRLEQMVTEAAILRRAKDAGVLLDSAEAVFAPDAPAPLAEVRRQFDQALLVALGAVVAACEPELVVLGGSISQHLNADLANHRLALERIFRVAPALVPARLGRFASVVGAVVLGLRESYADLGVPAQYLDDLPAVGLAAERLLTLGAHH